MKRTIRHISVAIAAVIFVGCACIVDHATWQWAAAFALSGGWLALYGWANSPQKERGHEK